MDLQMKKLLSVSPLASSYLVNLEAFMTPTKSPKVAGGAPQYTTYDDTPDEASEDIWF
jgi:hypothetical protein